MQDPERDLVGELKTLLQDGEEAALQIFLQLIRPEDVALWLDELTSEERQKILSSLDVEAAGVVLDDTTASIRAELVDDLEPERLARIAETLPADEAADLIGELGTHATERVLHHLDDENEQVLRDLLSYPEDTAGGIMNPEVVALTADATVDDAIRYLRSAAEGVVTAALYVVDDDRRLLGFVRLRRLVTARSTSKLGDIMSEDVISVDVNADQEVVADQVDRYDFIAIPVTDSNGRLLGAVTFDDILDVIETEATEDIYKMAGSSAEEEESESILHIARFRLPWLLVCLAGTQLSTLVLSYAQGRVGLYEQMSVFTAAIMAMAGNTSLQSSTTTVRRLALDNLPRGRFARHVAREISVALLMGMVCGLVAATLAIAFGNDPIIGLALGSAMAMGMSAASLLGAAMPLALDLVGIDPAVSSGPLVSTINDSLALALYFAVATGILFVMG
ncbi:MAG: magnesium transporter [Candidatus Sulfomarinibacteraceae bacterium]